MSDLVPPNSMPTTAEWQAAIVPFRTPSWPAARTQLWNTLLPYLACIALSYALYPLSYWAALPFIAAGGLFAVRIFIISHDCGHGSFTPDKRLNDRIGFWTGVLTFTPYRQWRHAHAIHHAHSGDVRHDGTGYIWVQTTRQYEAGTWLARLAYRLYRIPFLLVALGGPVLFLLMYRVPEKGSDARMRREVYAVNAFWLTFGAIVWLTMGPMALLAVQLPMTLITALIGTALFYFQHHYPDAYFGDEQNWDFTRAALEGSSFLALPRWLQFFSGNIGFHHIHHLSPKVPNYRLEACHEAVPFFKSVKPLSLRDCARALSFSLIDSDTNRWTTFRAAAAARRARDAGRMMPSGAPESSQRA